MMIGQGGYGNIYRIKNRVDGKEYAMKQIFVGNERNKQQAEAEIKTLSSFAHQNILRYVESFMNEGALCIVTELCD